MRNSPEQIGRWTNNLLTVLRTEGDVYRVDWEMAKDCLNRLIEGGKNAWQDDHMNAIRESRGKYTEFYYSTPYANQLRSYLSRVEKKMGNDQVLMSLYSHLSPLLEYADRLMAIKETLKTGRKPSTTPRKTPERTLVNTGTCGICGKNFKRDDRGNLVDHGYKVGFGQREGHCFGVASAPWELSPAVVAAYVEEVLKPYRLSCLRRIKRYEEGKFDSVTSSFRTVPGQRMLPLPLTLKRGEPFFDMVVHEELNSAKGDLRHTEDEIKYRESQVEAWKPSKLPG